MEQYLHVVWSEPEPGHEEELARWQDQVLMPSLLRVPGLLSARRYASLDGPAPGNMLICEIDAPEVLRTEAYIRATDPEPAGRVRPGRVVQTAILYQMIHPEVGRDKPAGDDREHFLLFVTTDPEPGWEDDFQAWYNTEHVPSLLGVPGFVSGRRYVALEGEPQYLALYEVESPEVFNGEVYRKARDTEWTLRSLQHRLSHSRNVYRFVRRG